MSIVSATRDDVNLTLTFVVELAAPPARAWRLWTDPRQLERWWGPPLWPATFVEHDVAVGGGSRYSMTGPDGERAGGWWRFIALDEPHGLEFDDGFADADGEPDTSMPTMRGRVRLDAVAGGTRMTVSTQFASLEQMEQLAAMGMVEGMTAAMGQIDAVLAED